MTMFLLFLFLQGLFTVIINQTIVDNKACFWITPAIFLTLPVVLMPVLVRIDRETVQMLIGNEYLMQTISLIMISEGILVIWMGLDRIKSHYDAHVKSKWTFMFVTPPLSCIAAILTFTLHIMNTAIDMNYMLISVICGIVGALIPITGPLAASRILSNWGKRFEIRILLALVQITGAVFIPLVVNPVSFRGQAISQSWLTTGLFAAIAGIFILGGFYISSGKNGRKMFNGLS